MKKLKQPIMFKKLLPSVITLIGLIVAMSAIRFAIDHKWEHAVYCILISGVLDGIDGRVARLLNATSPFGAELDSLCDFVNFGVSPSIIIYLWSFADHDYKLISWACILMFMVCMAIRLARFNTTIVANYNNLDKKSKHFSIGIPAPSGALLMLLPLMLDFEIGKLLNINLKSYTLITDLYIFIIAILLASRIPTFILKNIYIKMEYLSLIMILASIIIINIIIYPWYSLPVIAFLYIISIPISAIVANKIK